MERAKSASVFFLILLLGYLLIRVYSVTAERDHALELAASYRFSAESSSQTLARLEAMHGKTDALLALREVQHAQITQTREITRAAVNEAVISSPAFAEWRMAPLPSHYIAGPASLLGKTTNYYVTSVYSGQPTGGAHAAPASAGVAGQD